MNVVATEIPDVLLLEPRVFGDERGYLMECWAWARHAAAGVTAPFVQDNMSLSKRGIVRGLHLQHPHGQGKLVFVPDGEVFDVAVDVRVGSPTFGRHVSAILSSDNKRQLWIPPGFAHGFAVLSERALFFYKVTDGYHPEHEMGVAWDDPALGIAWPTMDPIVSPKDKHHPRLADIDPARLPRYVAP